MEAQLIGWISHYGAIALFALLALGVVGLPVPNETLLTVAGALIRKGDLSLVPTLVAACAGNISGVTMSYAIGRFAGAGFVKRHFEKGMDRIEHWFERSGKWTLAFGYFIPGVRHLTAVAAGSSGFPFAQFTRYAYGGAVVWTAMFLALGYFLGAELPHAFHDMHNKTLIACLIAGLAFAGYELATGRFTGR